ncbi:hypothetical protein HY994_00990 [Candidatus Micrarchaeota archaeon]|nr:hypothetical protein [Candidatus Micrarchaeota archaeon]
MSRGVGFSNHCTTIVGKATSSKAKNFSVPEFTNAKRDHYQLSEEKEKVDSTGFGTGTAEGSVPPQFSVNLDPPSNQSGE